MTSTTLTMATITAEMESALVNFLFSINSFQLLVIHEKTANIVDLVLHIPQKMSTPCKVLINKGRRTTIMSPANPEDHLKVIYCRANLDLYAKALIREYCLPILLFHE